MNLDTMKGVLMYNRKLLEQAYNNEDERKINIYSEKVEYWEGEVEGGE